MSEIKCFNDTKVQIEYPCKWEYRLIVRQGTDINSQIFELKLGIKYTITESNKNAKFISYKLQTTLSSEAQRIDIYDKLKSVKEIKYIM
ncbi:MAG: Unknown protein [uncultured Campylobacterales bacterium]|uniref:DUF493 domain-containing protein n=1 Tax=uncultured Campylobacterales bacterium TaxID=352960 RepID=A0A6S6SSR3_9BACT|nr:MAG: Unknown protein [uncultured Campylobacterales bacterium]